LFAQSVTAPGAAKDQAEKLHNDGLTLFQQGNPDEAAASVLASLRLHEQLGLKDAQAINLRALALVHDGMGERQKALDFYRRALTLQRALKDTAGEARTLRDLGVLFYNLDDNRRAFFYLEQALAIQRRIAKPSALAETLYSIGEMRRHYGSAAQARLAFEESLRIARAEGARENEANALASLAMLDLKAGRFDASRAALEAALAIRLETKDLRGEGSTRARLGLYHDQQGDPAAAREHLRAAIQAFTQAKYRGGEAFARQVLAHVERKSGRLAEAVAEMSRAVEIAESLRQRLADRDLRATYIGYVQNRYEFLIEALLELDAGDPRRAFEMSERARARALVEALNGAGVKDSAQPPSLTTAEIQARVLNAGVTLVEYALGEKHSYAFIVTPQQIAVRTLPARATLEAKARAAYAAYRDPTAPRPATEALRRLLLGDLPSSQRLLIVADGALQYLPFADLAGPGVPVVLAPSASAIAALRTLPVRRPARRLAVFADPVAPQLARLAFARTEAESILALVEPAQRFAAFGAEATPAAVLAQPASILHLATHSILDTARPERTEIVLSGGSLRLRDLYRLRTGARLVVLSACQTALGAEMKREGLIGLTRGFQQAGAASVVASLWKVEDRATAELMRHFYTALLRDARPAADALHHAQRQLAASPRWSHPFYWAGFVLQGEWR
ncbi:MAG: CHAT domain-containing protein, partial [Bryobacterales bacterium]|nr:CHAT domain-containing protein [Bryobacterales bacterium]